MEFKITKDWILAGNATFTVKNPEGKHYTFRVRTKKDPKGTIHFASLLVGQDNENDFVYLGVVTKHGGFRLTRGSKMKITSVPIQVLIWTLAKVWREEAFPQGYSVNHAGRCGRCGRKLTHPDGISDDGYRFGYGPECWKLISKPANGDHV